MSPGQSRVELPREETRGRQQDLVGPLELTNLPLQLPQPGGIGGRHPPAANGVDVRLLAPTPQTIDIYPPPRPHPGPPRPHRQLRPFLARPRDQPNHPPPPPSPAPPGSPAEPPPPPPLPGLPPVLPWPCPGRIRPPPDPGAVHVRHRRRRPPRIHPPGQHRHLPPQPPPPQPPTRHHR